MSQTFVVYKDGDPKKGEKHTRANANDLVNGAGYTWKPNQRDVTPAVYSPHRRVNPPTEKEPAQAVLDAHGHNAARQLPGASADGDGDDEVIDIADEGVEVVEDAEDDEPVIEDEADPEPVVEDEAPAAEPEAVEAAEEPAAPRRRSTRKDA